jgi:CheY-like chemotaxis protein
MMFRRLAQCVFEPDEVELIRRVVARITAQPWFTVDPSRRSDFALYVLQMYARGLVLQEKLESFCTIAAKKYHAVSPTSLEGRRILVVDDDYYAAKEAAKELTTLGATVVGPISNLSEAMDVAGRDLELDGALLDVNLDGQMVYPVAGFLKMHGIPFAFLTGYDGRVLPPAFRAAPLFVKPTDWAVIASEIPYRGQRPSV